MTNAPSVVRLEVHLDGQQKVYFREGQEAQAAVHGQRRTKLTAWFDLNKYSRMRGTCVGLDQLKYPDIPNYFTWKPREAFRIPGSNPKEYDFRRRADPVIGRMFTVSPRERERYFLRTLLLHMKGSSSYEDLRKVNGVPRNTFRDACAALGLLADDAEWRNALRESFASQFNPLTELFAIILVHCEPSDPLAIWQEHASLFVSDIRHRYRRIPAALNLLRCESTAKKYCLHEVSKSLLLMGPTSLSEFRISEPENFHLFLQIMILHLNARKNYRTKYEMPFLFSTQDRNSPSIRLFGQYYQVSRLTT